MLKKIVDVLKEVFWLKKSRKKPVRKTAKKTVKKPVKRVAKASKSKKPSPTPRTPKKAVKPIAALKVKAAKKISVDPDLKPMGEITHYFDRIKVAVVKINLGTVLIGDRLTVVGAKYKFVQKIWSMQIESQDVKVAKKGQLIGIKVDRLVTVGDIVYR
jgi:hypothetical protein